MQTLPRAPTHLDPATILPNEEFRSEFDALRKKRLEICSILAMVVVPLLLPVDVLYIGWVRSNPWSELAPFMAVRFGFTLWAGLLLLILRRSGGTRGALALADWGVFVGVSLALSVLGVRAGGIDTPYYATLLMVLLVRSIFVPGRARDAVIVGIVCWLTYPITVVAGAALGLGTLAAQLADSARFAAFMNDNMIVLTSLVLSAIGARIVNRLQADEYRLHRATRFEIVRPIGAGGMGEVFLVRHGILKSLCAMKVLPQNRASTAEDLDSFETEARRAAQLFHPNTVRIFDFGAMADGRNFFTMEYLQGMDLGALLREAGPLPPGRLVHLAVQICRALEHVHASGIVHRDIKPQNVFVLDETSEPDFVKVLDFGLALPRLAIDGDPTGAGGSRRRILGTPRYIPPERVLGTPEDARSDLYAVGCVLYEMATGRAVFQHPDARALLELHASAEPEPISNHVPAFPADLEAVVLGCLAKDPAQRPPSAAALEKALLACDGAEHWSADQAKTWWDAHSAPDEAPSAEVSQHLTYAV